MSLRPHKNRQSSTSSLSRLSAASALRRGEIKISEPIPLPREGTDGLGPQIGINRNAQPFANSAGPDTQLRQKALDSSGNTDSFAFVHQESPIFSKPNYDAVQHDFKTSRTSAASNDSTKHRRSPSSLKSVIRRLFGSKKKREENVIPEEIQTHRTALHRSVGWNELDGRRRANDYQVPPGFKSRETLRQTRSSSLPIQEVTRSSALGSHNPNVTNSPPQIFEPYSRPDFSSLEEPPSFYPLQRRATLPSLIFTTEEASQIASKIDGFAHGPEPEALKSDEAVTEADQTPHFSNNPNRRSRSASALRELAKTHRMSPIQWRRRSDEIRYWRMSAGIPVSSSEPPEDMPPELPGGETPVIVTSTSDHASSQHAEEEVAPSFDDGFDFGTMIGSMQQSDISLEQRVNTLEVKCVDLEYAIAKLQGHDVAALQPIVLENRPEIKEADQPAVPPQPAKQANGGTFLESPDKSPVIGFSDDSKKPRPLSIDTLRPRTALRQSLLSSQMQIGSTSPSTTGKIQTTTFTQDTYDALLSLVEAEKRARQTLENQVAQLQQEMKLLRSTTAYTHGRTGSYPTPSPDYTQSQPRQCPPRMQSDTDEDTDTEDGFLESFATPTEVSDDHPSRFGHEAMSTILPAGML